MKELTLPMLIAVWEEMFGQSLFWALAVLAFLVTLAYVFVLLRDRSLSMRRFLLAQLSMPFGAIASVMFVQRITSSRLRDIGGPIDVLVLLAVGAVGAVGLAILVYTTQSLLRKQR
ncbi:DUF5368 domain-containing protein [Pseudotabrizicola algicola]|uniref:DUF5368 domain-containing protein n=1 Tax=Pseudotabrizicola algicola TaxID=2709381 RepID=A0A6B3RPN3_9RHOB|nr:DUF5368 domain-containing protein [Pseudotabrizicola algicola]NEX45069.1 DUF5368 domain-containing protein [Pseudotabrizicola algicola]